MPRTRIRSDQAQDISFVSETELNQFLDAVVITGTEDATAVVQLFDDYFPGRGLLVGVDGTTVVTGTQLVTISGFRGEFLSASGTLQADIDEIVGGVGGVASLTASGVTITGAITFDSLNGITLIPDLDTKTITFSGSGISGEDIHHFSFEIIASGITKEIPFTHQMTVHENLDLEETGALLIEGTVILEI
ncbi:hypothetical protein LCGC14_1444520 [marine sediment metagenome]|uniref:Uncharacterized protein n=1 Tax=marine sediment metagenome TaxID=412755 RepID=A0A0F9M068_9ZZZZ